MPPDATFLCQLGALGKVGPWSALCTLHLQQLQVFPSWLGVVQPGQAGNPPSLVPLVQYSSSTENVWTIIRMYRSMQTTSYRHQPHDLHLSKGPPSLLGQPQTIERAQTGPPGDSPHPRSDALCSVQIDTLQSVHGTEEPSTSLTD